MKKISNRLFPRPLQTFALLAIWLLLNNTIALSHVVLGFILATAIPILTRSMLDDHPKLHRPWLAIKYLLVLLKDIAVCNVEVAIQVMGPVSRINPGFIAIPLDITGKFPITLLANTISLTPGTVSAEVSEDLQWLYVHVLNLGDEEAVIRSIKQNYEAPLKEMFAC